MPPLWKLRRECHRTLVQVLAVLGLFVDYLQRRHYERNRSRLVRRQQGDRPLSGRIAIYVVWQPQGFSRSTEETCRFLASKDFSVVLVSNSSLTGSDRIVLLPFLSLLIYRPNQGYDFGGYKEGILTLFDLRIHIQELLLLNDSIWFPIFPNTDLIERFRSSRAEIVSPIFYRYSGSAEKDYLQSYMLFIKHNVVCSAVFFEFWKNYRSSNNKYLTVRRGEMGFSRAMRSAGFSLDAVYRFEDCLCTINGLSVEQCEAVIDHEIAINSVFKKTFRDLSRSPEYCSSDSRDRLRLAIGCRSWSRYLLKAHPLLSNSALRIPFIKKDKTFPYDQVRREWIRWRTRFEDINEQMYSEVEEKKTH